MKDKIEEEERAANAPEEPDKDDSGGEEGD